MDKQSMLQVAEFLDKKRKRMRWIRIICAVAAVVVFCTIYALILPAVTMEREASCGFEEHQHVESCYQVIEPQKQLNCVYIPHEHGTECYDEAEQLICEIDVETEHVHGDECYVAVETETAEPELICQLPEHSHVESCYPTQGADLTADVETAADWEATFAHVELTGDWRTDVLAIAETQLGYEESTENYMELETGDRKGYTRYGAWYGDSYGDWCAMFISFCLNYAEIPEEAFPRESNCSNWIEALTELGLYQEASAETLPTEGDLIFFNWDEYEDSDHVGLVTEVVTNEDGATTITTIEGNASDVVKHKTYELGDESIMGYGVLVVEHVPQLLLEDITSDKPTPTWYTSTSEFIELNLYDYNYYINDNYDADNKYPGFQWNGGAYANSDYKHSYANADEGIPNYITDRNYIDSIDFGNSMITNFQYQGSNYGKSTTSVAVGKLYNNSGASSTGKINWLWYDGSDYGTTTNRPVGISTGYESLSKTLVDGYPALSDGTSLAYLFTEGTAVDKLNTASIDGLFQQDSVSGEYSYNSRTNHAQYDDNFFTLYEEIITPNFITYPFGNFLPLNTITDSTQATQVGSFNYDGGMKDYVEGIIDDLDEDLARDDAGDGATDDYGDTSRRQLKVMLQEYRENWKWFPSGIGWDNLSAANAIRDYFTGDSSGDGDAPSSDTGFITQEHLDQMYNIDWDVATNFFFGMDMKMNFMMPKGGMTGNDTNGDGASDYPMVFKFTGDDDVWVYIDGVLFLDLTGIHRHVGGEIDFVNGEVHYYELNVENGGDISTTPYVTYTFEQILTAAGKSTDGLNDKGTFKDYTTHTFNFYYMERGSGSSVCRLNFNFPLLKENSITVSKQNVPDDTDVELAGNPDYYFNIVTPDNTLFVGPDSVTGVTEYTILDSGGNKVGTGKTDEYGIFTLKAGQSAVFEGIEENKGKYYVQELIKEEDHEQYKDKVTVNGVESRYNDLIDWSYRTYFTDTDNDNRTGPYGYKWYAYSGHDTDSSANRTFYFEAQNGVITKNLQKLSIKKQVEAYDATSKEETYLMYVTLDGVPLPVGSEYVIGTTTKTVSTEGYIELKAGETATISNILSGTKFTVKEAETSAKGYTVTYAAEGADEVTSDGGSITGVIRKESAVSVTVKNVEHGATAVLPVTKSLAKSDGNTYTFDFLLQEVMDQTGTTLVTNGLTQNASITVKDENVAENAFNIIYFEKDFESLPVKKYYKITEVSDPNQDTVQYDISEYVAEITISNGAAGFQAEITNIWKDGVSLPVNENSKIAFTNMLLRDLTLAKELVTDVPDVEKEFSFEITLTQDGKALSGTYKMLHSNSTDTTDLTFDAEGKATVTVAVGESITIQDLPYGVTWNIRETNSDGYKVTYKIGNDGEEIQGVELIGETLNENILVTCTNYTSYELPETGGIGTNSFIIGGATLMGMALLLLYNNKKRRKEAGASS